MTNEGAESLDDREVERSAPANAAVAFSEPSETEPLEVDHELSKIEAQQEEEHDLPDGDTSEKKVSLQRWDQKFRNESDVIETFVEHINELLERTQAAGVDVPQELRSIQFAKDRYVNWSEQKDGRPNVFLAPAVLAAAGIAEAFVDARRFYDAFWASNLYCEVAKVLVQSNHEKYSPLFERLLSSACLAISGRALPSQDSVGEPSLAKLRDRLENIAGFALGTFFHRGKKEFYREQRPDTVMQNRVIDITLAAHFDTHLRYLLSVARPRVNEYVTANMPIVYRMRLPNEWSAKRKEWERLLGDAGFGDDLRSLESYGDLVVAEEVGDVPRDLRDRLKLAAQNNDYSSVIERLQKFAKELRAYLYKEAQRRLVLRAPVWPRVPQEHLKKYNHCKRMASMDDQGKLQKALAILQDIWQADIQNIELRDLVAYLEARTGNIAAAEQKLQHISRRRDSKENFATNWNLAFLAYERGEEGEAYNLLIPLLAQRAADEDLVMIILALSLKLNDAASFLETIPRTMSRRFHPLAIVVAHNLGDQVRVKELWGELVNQWDRNTEDLPPVPQRFSADEFQKTVNQAIVNGQIDQLVAWLEARVKTQGAWVPNYLALASVLERECEDIDKAFDVLRQRCDSMRNYRKDDRQRRLDDAFRDLFELCRRNRRKDLGERAFRLSEQAGIGTSLRDSFKAFAPSKEKAEAPEPAPKPPSQPPPRPIGIFRNPNDAERFTWTAARLSDVRDVESYVTSAGAIDEFVNLVSGLSPDGGGAVVNLIKNVSEAVTAFSRTSKDDKDARLHLYEKAVDYESRLRKLIAGGALEQGLADVITPYCKSLQQVVGDLTREAGIGPSVDVCLENSFYSIDAPRSTIVLRLKNTSDRPMTDVWVEVLFDAPQLMPITSRECRIKRLDAQDSYLFSIALRRNREISANDISEITLRVSLKASAEGYPNYDLGMKKLQLPLKSLREAVGEDSIPRLFIVGKPLTPSVQSLFQGREEIMSKIKSSFYGGTQRERYFLDGIRRAGKTSILNFLPGEIPDQVFPVLVNLDRFDLRPPINSPAVLQGLCQEVANVATRQERVTLQMPDQAIWDSTPAQAFDMFLAAFSDGLPGRVPCLMIDEFQEILQAIARSGSGHDQDTLVLDQLRGHMDEGRIYAVFTGSVRFDRLAKIMEHRIFGSLTRLRVSFLSEEGVASVLHAGMGNWVNVTPESISRISMLTGGYPWLVQTYGAELVDLLNQEQRTVATTEDVDHVTRETVLCNDELFSFWWPADQLGTSEERFIEWLLNKYKDPRETVYIRDFFNDVPAREQPTFKKAFENLRACEVLDSTQTQELRFRGDVLRQWLESQINDEKQLKIRGHMQVKSVDRGHAGIFIDHENLLHSLTEISQRRGVPVPNNRLEWFAPILARLLAEAERRVGPLIYKVTVAFWSRPHEASLTPAYFSNGFDLKQPEEVKMENAVDFKVADEIRRANEQALKQNTRLGNAILVCGDGDLSHVARSLINDGVDLQVWGGSQNTSRMYEEIVGKRNVIELDDICGL